MSLQYTTVDEKSFSYGIDARSAENQVKEGFIRDLVNGDIIEGRVKKRKGYVSYAGHIPVRVLSYRQESGDKVCFTLDGSIDLSRVESTPIIAYGKTSLTGPFSSTTTKYYTSWTANLRKVMAANTTGTISAPASEHNITSSNIFTGLAIATGTGSDLSGELVEPDSLAINGTTYDITATYTNGDGQKDTFLYYLDRNTLTGETYVGTYTRSDSTPITISAATHQLANYNIVPEVLVDDSGTWKKIIPDEFTIDTSSGLVTCIVAVTASTTIKIILSAVSAEQSQNIQLNNGSSTTVVIPNVNSPFIFGALYTKSGNTNTLVFPDNTSYNDTTGSLSLTYTNGSPTVTGIYYYNYGSIRANELCVTDAAVSTNYGTDSSPQLTLYGLDHTLIYGSGKQVNRRGWVTHIDSYRSPTTTHMVAGLGGNLFAALTVNEAPSTYLASMPTYYARLQSRLASSVNIGPAFYDTGDAPARSRGVITFDSGGTNWATVTGVEYQADTGWTRYTLATPNRALTGGTLNDIISVTPNLEDYLTVKNMSHSRHTGDFLIKGRGIIDSDTLYIDVYNPNIVTDDYDDVGCAGLGGIFTDQLPFAPPDEFLAGDQLLSSFWGEDVQLIVKETSGDTTVITNVYDYRVLAAGLLIAGLRTSNILAFRDTTNTAKIDYLVAGDVLSSPAFDYPLVIQSIDTTNKTVLLDNPITWYDDTTNVITFSVSRRWVPREMPTKDTGDNLINDQISRYFANNNYDAQPFLRSVMVQNNMYLTNGDDEVYKYDGVNTYRAGIIPWQPGLFSLIESTTTGGISLAPGVANDSGTSSKLIQLVGGRIKIDKTQAAYFTDGDTVIIRDGTLSPVKDYTVTILGREEETSGTHSYFSFVEPLPFTALGTGASVQMIKCYFARYYFRLHLKDRNGVVVSSAVTGAEDFVTLVAPTTTNQQKVHIRLIGLPAWDHYDYSNKNLELKIYRTLWSTTSVGETSTFYEVSTKQLPYTGADGYIDFIDTLGNNTLIEGDSVVGVLAPNTTPAGWDEPVRAKYLTSAGNRLVLANITDWPTLAITYLTSGAVANTAYAGQKFLFKRDPSLLGNPMLNYATYELKNTGSVTISSFASTTGGFTITIPSPGRAPVIGDWVYIYFASASSHPLDFCGWWQIANVSGAGPYVCTIKSNITFAAPTHTHTALFATTAYDIPVNIGTDYNMSMVNGDVVTFDTPAPRILRRIGLAINATMRMVDTSITGYSSFTPWLTARSESDTSGQLIVKQPRADITAPSLTITNSTSVPIYVNGAKTVNGSVINSLITSYPSRLLVSYNNYPEIFDNPFTVNDDSSVSAIDINSSDGQEITGVIPFFGESAFGAALQSGVIVVFKQNSIYLVDLAEKRAGRNPVQRIETQGLGCTAPYSIAPTKDGIAFANDSGIYVLRRNQRIEYLGRYMERNWQNKVNRAALAIMQGHHYNVGRQYKLSIPLLADSVNGYVENSEVYVYNHTNEGTDEPGGWGRYTNHPATGWANLFQDAFYGSANGSVMRIRVEDVPEDYRDGADAIEVIFEGRATDFGQAGIRKVVSHVIVNYRTGGISEYTSLEASPDLLQQYDSTTPFAVINAPTNNGFSTLSTQDVVTIRHSLTRRRCIYMTIKISNNGLDEALEIAGMSFVVAGLNTKGITQAATTKSQSGV